MLQLQNFSFVFFYTFFLLSNCYLSIKLCSCILLLNLFSIFMMAILNFLSGNLYTSNFLGSLFTDLLYSFYWATFFLFLHVSYNFELMPIHLGEKDPPLLVFTNWPHAGKYFYHSRWLKILRPFRLFLSTCLLLTCVCIFLIRGMCQLLLVSGSYNLLFLLVSICCTQAL